jgi:hypothetical protein
MMQYVAWFIAYTNALMVKNDCDSLVTHLFRYYSKAFRIIGGRMASASPLSQCPLSTNVLFTSSLFVIGFLEGLNRGHEDDSRNYKALVLLRPIVQSSLGAAILGAKSINEKFPVDYSKNTESFFTFTPGCS